MDVSSLNIRELYANFDQPVTELDCGVRCAQYNQNKIPFCCDICHAVPAAYHREWAYLQEHTDMWHIWRGDECRENPEDPRRLLEETPDHMLLLACQGIEHCQRDYRVVSCRQFPFFPYISSDLRFLGLAYEWEFEQECWVISNLGAVTVDFQREFIHLYDSLFALWPEEFEGYALKSEDIRFHYQQARRRFPILHRNGGLYLVSPGTERLYRTQPGFTRRFGPYLK